MMREMRVKATYHSLIALTVNIGNDVGPLNKVEELVALMLSAGYKLDIAAYLLLKLLHL